METVETQVEGTTTSENKVGTENTTTPVAETKVETGNGSETKPSEPYKTFTSKEDFDKHSAGILNSAKNKAEKELLALLGLKPDEKDKLIKFKEAYDNTLSESEKQAQTLENLNSEVNSLKSQIAEKDAIIVALSKMTGKNPTDVDKYVRMAKGLVDENTNIDQALEQVFGFMKVDEPKTNPVPAGKPLSNPAPTLPDENPFKTGNMTKQGELIRTDREKARTLYMAVHGVGPSW